MSRASTTREAETRANEVRQDYNMEYISPLSIPAGLQKEGYKMAWINLSIRGEPTGNVMKATRNGWVPVEIDRAPHMNFDILKTNPLSEKYIIVNDVMLMERPTQYWDSQLANLRKKSNEIINSLTGVYNDTPKHRMNSPAHIINSF